jgi:O-antigen ligase
MKINYSKKFNSLLSLLVLISPVLFLTVKHWTNLIVLFIFISCLFSLLTDKEIQSPCAKTKHWRQLICGMLAAPLIAIALGQLFRLNFYSPNWDGPLRLVLCIPIFLIMANGSLRTDSGKSISQIWIIWILSLTLIWTLFFRINWPTFWGSVDLTTYFVDPLTFGSYTLLFSLITLLGLSERWNKLSLATKCFCMLGVLSGFYLSLTSGSRTGWFNLPVFLGIWTVFVLKPNLGARRTSLLVVFLITLLSVALVGNSYLMNKFILIWTEFVDYKFNAPNEDTSVGLRLSFSRMGLAYILEKPFTGWGDLGWMTQMNRPDLTQFASDFARESPKHGFHNEIITNTVRSGIWGLIASVSLFVVVFVRAIQGLRLKSTGEHRLISLTLLVFISHLFIAGLTTEITNLVFLSSFIGLTLAVLLGDQIYLEEKLSLDAKI